MTKATVLFVDVMIIFCASLCDRPDEIPFFLPPRFKPTLRSEEGEEEGRKDLSNTHRGSLTVGSRLGGGEGNTVCMSRISPTPTNWATLCYFFLSRLVSSR